MALGAELAQDMQDDKHREANGSAAFHDSRCVRSGQTNALTHTVILNGERLKSRRSNGEVSVGLMRGGKMFNQSAAIR